MMKHLMGGVKKGAFSERSKPEALEALEARQDLGRSSDKEQGGAGPVKRVRPPRRPR